jgi:ribonucleoside-diphosphate reductase beta chain
MKGAAEQFQYIMRDEVLHCAFGVRVLRELVRKESLTLDPCAVQALWQESEALESAYAGYILREPILGYSAELHLAQFRFIANRRARQLGLADPFPGATNALPWLDEQANLRKQKNFFEPRVTEYQTGGALKWD